MYVYTILREIQCYAIYDIMRDTILIDIKYYLT